MNTNAILIPLKNIVV